MVNNSFKILSLDGGGSKGIYSLGILLEIEAKLGSPLVNHFDCFYGCSTGAIIAALLAQGRKVEDIKNIYLHSLPNMMKTIRIGKRTKILCEILKKEFGDKKFDSFNKFVCVVATAEDGKTPKLFKSHVAGAHGRKESFAPGFGYTIAEALVASCAATPFFEKATFRTGESLVDGGFCLGNPTLFAIIDSLKAFQKKKEEIVIINVGTGNFPHRVTLPWLWSVVKHRQSADILTNLSLSHSNMAALVTMLLFDDMKILRVSEDFPDLKTNIVESDMKILEKLFSRGRASFGKKEKDFESMLRLCKNENSDG